MLSNTHTHDSTNRQNFTTNPYFSSFKQYWLHSSQRFGCDRVMKTIEVHSEIVWFFIHCSIKMPSKRKQKRRNSECSGDEEYRKKRELNNEVSIICLDFFYILNHFSLVSSCGCIDWFAIIFQWTHLINNNTIGHHLYLFSWTYRLIAL